MNSFIQNLKGLNNFKFPAKTKTVFVGRFVLIFQEKTSEIDISQYIQAGNYKKLLFWDDFESEKGACGRYNDKEKRGNIDLSLF